MSVEQQLMLIVDQMKLAIERLNLSIERLNLAIEHILRREYETINRPRPHFYNIADNILLQGFQSNSFQPRPQWTGTNGFPSQMFPNGRNNQQETPMDLMALPNSDEPMDVE